LGLVNDQSSGTDRRIAARDLEDAAVPALSEDRRFATVYNAALQAAKMAFSHYIFGNKKAPG